MQGYFCRLGLLNAARESENAKRVYRERLIMLSACDLYELKMSKHLNFFPVRGRTNRVGTNSIHSLNWSAQNGEQWPDEVSISHLYRYMELALHTPTLASRKVQKVNSCIYLAPCLIQLTFGVPWPQKIKFAICAIRNLRIYWTSQSLRSTRGHATTVYTNNVVINC